MSSFYSEEELKDLGLKAFGRNVLISRKCSIYGAKNILLGSNVRIDDFCILSGQITIGSNVHISAYNALYGSKGIEIGDFCGISPRCTLFSATDDFSGEYMVSPMVPEEFTNVQGGKIVLTKYVQIGSGTIIMPNVVFGEGAATGAMSLIKSNVPAWKIYAGVPAKEIKERSRNLLKFAEKCKFN
ncbi:MAG: acyltransferase [Lactobacillaceae bacterium]|jgi:galactoside O-acetyltransferase|nr:acyltransferase [Lactobacillaceae bacterium]